MVSHLLCMKLIEHKFGAERKCRGGSEIYQKCSMERFRKYDLPGRPMARNSYGYEIFWI